MARRVALARAIALDPALLMCDEPFAGLDRSRSASPANLIRSLNDALGATMIVVARRAGDVPGSPDYVYFIANGRIAAEGEPAASACLDQIRLVHQFVQAEADGPVPFHYRAPSLADDFARRR